MQDVKKWTIILVPTFLVFGLLFYLLYIYTDIGLSETICGIVPMYAPAWFEALVTTLFVPFMTGFSLYDEMYGI